MASRDGGGSDHLTHLAQLSDSPEKFHIFQALRIIDASFPDSPRLGESRRPREDKVRLGQEAELKFPPSTIRAFEPPAGKKPGKLTNRFFGLFGPQGPLPLHLTEYARDRKRNHRDSAFVDFCNALMTHRLLSLFFRAWASSQPTASMDKGGEDIVAAKIASFSGYNGRHLLTCDAFPENGKQHFAGLLAQGTKTPEGLTAILSSFFDGQFEIEQFVGSWLELEPDDQWVLGNKAGLGQSTSIGTRVWSRNAKFRIRVGPLSLADYERLLPGRDSIQRLRAIVRNYVGDALDWDVNIVLRAEDVPQASLGGTTLLGQTSWIGKRKSSENADDLFLTSEILAGFARKHQMPTADT